MPKTYAVTPTVRFINRIMMWMVRWGLGPAGTYTLTVSGRKSGKRYSTPVTLIEQENQRWLVSPYGEVNWVKNARATGEVTLSGRMGIENLAIHELDPEAWAGFTDYMDLINLWVWNAKDLPGLDKSLERCRKIFPDKPIVMGIYLRDYTTRASVPMNLLKHQWERVEHYVSEGRIEGYSILAAVLIDGHQEQANWIRDFIAER